MTDRARANVSLNIRRLRIARGWSQAQLAERLNDTSQTDVSYLERGFPVTVERLEAIAETFAVTVAELQRTPSADEIFATMNRPKQVAAAG